MDKSTFIPLSMLFILLGYFIFTKPNQPPGYQRYICQEAYEGAIDECIARGIGAENCKAIADSSRHMCDGALPEENATP